MFPQLGASPPEHGLVELADIHTRRHPQRIQDDVNRLAVLGKGHIFLGDDHRDDAFVPVTAGHLVAHGYFPLVGDVDFCQLDDPRLEFIPDADFEHRLFQGLFHLIESPAVAP